MNEHKFNGNGFRKDAIEGEEAARHRHMYMEISQAWPTIEQANTVIESGRIAVKVVAGGAIIGGALKALGWLPI